MTSIKKQESVRPTPQPASGEVQKIDRAGKTELREMVKKSVNVEDSITFKPRVGNGSENKGE